MHPADIIALLSKRGIAIGDIARREQVSSQIVGCVIRGEKRSLPIAQCIASVTGKTLEQLWPGAYQYAPRGRWRDRFVSRQAA